VPIPGTSSIKRLEENAGATEVRLTPADLAEIDRIAPKGAAVGQRYTPAMMEMVNR
jgi:aryl-alcohol dehydrogenase-like predicted oxidoreductase